VNRFEALLPEFARTEIETRLHIVSCEHMRLMDFREHLGSIAEVLVGKVLELMVWGWGVEDYGKGLTCTVEVEGQRLVPHFTGPEPDVIAFLNSLEPAVAHVPLSDDYITDF
jgi:hypothetical protein